jgi:hypothetical protein
MKEEGFSAKYWSDNYNDPNSMDGIGNAKDHVRYLKALLTLDNVKINSIIDFGFGKSVLLKEMITGLNPYKTVGIEPSKYIFEQIQSKPFFKNNKKKVKLYNFDLKTWCQKSQGKNERFDLGICTSVLQYLPEEELKVILPIIAEKVKYMYLTVPTNKELNKQINDLDFLDTYAIRRSKTFYYKIIKKYFTFISNRVLESKTFFDEENTSFSELLFRF